VVQHYGDYAEDAQQRVVLAVAEDDADLAFVPTGVFDTFGVTSLQALSAPMLMHSYAVEQQVLTSDIAATMLAGVDRAGVAGIALLGDQMRRPFGVIGPLHGPDDYRGVTVATDPSRATDGALEALGARPSHLLGAAFNRAVEHHAVGGLERPLRTYVVNVMAPLAPYGTSNVALWPQVLAVIANPETMSRLDDDQRRWLAQAAADVAGSSVPRAREAERDGVAAMCRAGGRLSRASEADITALKTRFAQTYATLEKDATTRGLISRIRELDDAMPPDAELVPLPGCSGRPPAPPKSSAAATGRFDGTWRWRLTQHDRRNDPHGNGEASPGDDVFTMRIDDGRWHLHLDGADGSTEDETGSVTLDGGELAFTWDRGASVDRFRFRLDGDELRLTGTSGDTGDLFVWATERWRRIR
jgi:TRAP-type C4-dicarboxylate transport system substrate-binding protein